MRGDGDSEEVADRGRRGGAREDLKRRLLPSQFVMGPLFTQGVSLSRERGGKGRRVEGGGTGEGRKERMHKKLQNNSRSEKGSVKCLRRLSSAEIRCHRRGKGKEIIHRSGE